MTTEAPAANAAPGSEATAPTVIPAATAAVYDSLLEAIPLSGGDGMDGILRALAEATDFEDLDAPWRTEGMESLLNQPLAIRGLRRVESDYAGGLSWFLVVDAVVIATGELVTFTTGAVSVVAQLAKAWSLGVIPGLRVIPRQSDRPSANGYYPQHLEIVPRGAKD